MWLMIIVIGRGPAKVFAGYAAFWRSYINHVFIFKTDCEHGKLAVKTSKIFLKKQIKHTKAKISWQKKSRSIKKNSQIPTHYRNVTLNFQGTDFLKKAVQIPLSLLLFFNHQYPKHPFIQSKFLKKTLNTVHIFYPMSGHPAINWALLFVIHEFIN